MLYEFALYETRKDTDVRDLTVSLGKLSSTENTPTKPEQGKDLSHKAECSKVLFKDKLRRELVPTVPSKKILEPSPLL